MDKVSKLCFIIIRTPVIFQRHICFYDGTFHVLEQKKWENPFYPSSHE